MAKKAKHNKKTNAAAKNNNAGIHPDRTEYLAVLPGLLMCAMIILILLLDIAVPGMKTKQYNDFKTLFRVLNFTAIAAGAAFLCTDHLRSFCTSGGRAI